MVTNETPVRLGLGARLFRGAVLTGLAVMTCAATYQTWRQIVRPDFTDVSRSPEGDGAPVIEWSLLRQLDLKTGRVPEALQKRNGSRVRIAGFMMPLEDGGNHVPEFLLVPYFGACIHTPPPPSNQIVQVQTLDQRPVSFTTMEPVWVTGDLRISYMRNQFGNVWYQMRAVAVEPYKEEKQ